MSEVRSILYEDFSLGIDTSRGLLSRDARKFLELDNYVVNTSRQLERRRPCALLTGQRDADTQGLLYLNGQFITIAKSGDTVVNTITTVTITTLYFDNPEYCTTWTLLELFTVNEKVCALIRHVFAGTLVTERIMLHVWDDQRPTWVDDPAVPTNWTSTFPLHAFGIGKLGNVKSYVPTVALSSDKVFITRPDGNTAFSGTNKPRVWNDRSAAEILLDGRWWYWISPAVAIAEVVIPVNYGDFITAGTYAGYVLEVALADGTWGQFTEVSGGPTGVLTYALSSVVNRFDVTKPSETKITFWLGADQVVRFRALARPALTIQSGEYLVPSGAIVGGMQTIEVAAEQTATVPGATVLATLAQATSYLVVTKSARTPPTVVLPNTFAGNSATMPLNGQQRYWARIIAAATTNAAGPPPTAFSFDFTGTVTVAANSQVVVGVGTLFLTEARTGDTIEVNGEKRIVRNIQSNLLMEVSVAFTSAAGGVAAARDVRYKYAYELGEVGNPWYAAREAEATLQLAGAGNAGVINTSLYDNSGGVPVCLAPGQNRLFVQYLTSLQMWGTDPDPKLMRMLATSEFGSGPNLTPRAALVDGFTVLPTHLGPRMFSPDGFGKDYIRMLAISDSLRGTELPSFTQATWWARTRILVMSGATDGRIFTFSYQPEAKVMAWSIWTVSGLTAIDRLFTAGEYLYVVSGLFLYRFDPNGTVYRDSTGVYESHALWLFNDLGQPARNKHLVRFEIQQQGTCEVKIRVSPAAPTEYVTGPPVAQGYTQGLTKAPLAVYTPAVGLEISSTDETGHILSAIGYDFRLSAR